VVIWKVVAGLALGWIFLEFYGLGFGYWVVDWLELVRYPLDDHGIWFVLLRYCILVFIIIIITSPK
jgi:hypothetical protein